MNYQCLAVIAEAKAVLEEAKELEHLSLNRHEVSRAQSLRILQAREAYLAAHILVRQVAGTVVRADPSQLTVTQICRECGGNHGQPRIKSYPHLHVSLSHTNRFVAAIAGPSKNGIDVEEWDNMDLRLLLKSNIFCNEEIRLIKKTLADHPPLNTIPQSLAAKLWTRKECLIKLGQLTLDKMDQQNALIDFKQNPDEKYGYSEWENQFDRAFCTAASLDKITLIKPDSYKIWLSATRSYQVEN